MDQWRSHIPSNNLPKQFCEWSFEQGDRKSQQNELELVLELDGDFFGRKKKCVGAGISGGEPPWAHEAGGAPWTLVARCQLPLMCSQCQIFSNIPEKNHISISGHLENFYFRGIFYCTDNSENRQKILFLLYLM